jgi:hypothetical protein
VLSLAACARFSLVLAGLSPVVWLLSGWVSYHGTVVTVTLACAVAGLMGASLLLRGLARGGGSSRVAALASVIVFATVGAQTSWLLRPFVVRPRADHVVFLRPIEGDLIRSAFTSARSATGEYGDEPGGWIGRRAPAAREIPAESDPRSPSIEEDAR